MFARAYRDEIVKVKITVEWRNHTPIRFVNVFARVCKLANGFWFVATCDNEYKSDLDKFDVVHRCFYTAV